MAWDCFPQMLSGLIRLVPGEFGNQINTSESLLHSLSASEKIVEGLTADLSGEAAAVGE